MEPRRPLLAGIVIIPLAKCYLGRIVSRKHERDLRGDPPIVLPITEINAVDSAVVARHIGFMTSRNRCVPISGGIREIISLPR